MGDIEASYRAQFERLNATVRIVERFHAANPFANKLRLLELPDVASFDEIVLLDCDTIFVQDPAAHLRQGVLQARTAGYATVSAEVFAKLFAHFQLPLPPAEHRCSVSGDPTIWYRNDGVVVLPNAIWQQLFPVWRNFTTEVCSDPDLLTDVGSFCTQAALTLAFSKCPVAFRELPLELNCPIPENLTSVLDAVGTCDPVVIHYHDRVTPDGQIKRSDNPFAQMRIDAFNQRVTAEVGFSA